MQKDDRKINPSNPTHTASWCSSVMLLASRQRRRLESSDGKMDPLSMRAESRPMYILILSRTDWSTIVCFASSTCFISSLACVPRLSEFSCRLCLTILCCLSRCNSKSTVLKDSFPRECDFQDSGSRPQPAPRGFTRRCIHRSDCFRDTTRHSGKRLSRIRYVPGSVSLSKRSAALRSTLGRKSLSIIGRWGFEEI